VPEQTFIALLRGINVGGNRSLPMERLRALCTELGWSDVRTYIQSGNVLFRSKSAAARIERTLEDAIEHAFGFPVPVILRSAAQWESYTEGHPFPEESEAKLVMLALAQKKPHAGAAEALQARAAEGERIVRVGDALWIHFAAGVAKSKLSPGLLDRVVGSPVTTRNWRTVVKLGELARG
jgi:uncharacterized protein (DUF1697 family)